ncbi:MAG: hypothetical protein C0456_06935 [Hyphomonas sp.]|uniref:hypothetical protein n=1 Tax=Hyphomonas sp. TaxID=87 RepID=UPI001DF1CEC1|nr:hypothetical protein [Hyphomonas sp.]MBA4226351.1 hypothetical protein [Hyphomonas sp.]
MSRRPRFRSSDEAGAASTPRARTIDDVLEDISHELKLIDIKRRMIADTTARLPWLYIATAVLGFFLLGSILSLSIFFIFIFGSLFSGALANIIGPLGALTARKRAYREVADIKERLFPKLLHLTPEVSTVLVGVSHVGKDGVRFSQNKVSVTALREEDFDMRGAMAFGYYKYLAFLFRNTAGSIDLTHPAIRQQYWLTEARRRGLGTDALSRAVAEVV